MLFGFDRATDEASLGEFLRRLGDEQCHRVLVSRMSEAEIQQVVDVLTRLMQRHLTHDEYHALFLSDAAS